MVQAKPSLTFSQAISAWGSRMFEFKGRSRRSEFWWTQLLVFLSNLLTPLVGGILGMLVIPQTVRRLHDTGRSGWWYGVYLILQVCVSVMVAYDVFSFLMALLPRRSHPDSDGVAEMLAPYVLKYVFVFLFLMVCSVVIVVMCCLDSEAGANKWGPSPKYAETDCAEGGAAATQYAGREVEPLDLEK